MASLLGPAYISPSCFRPPTLMDVRGIRLCSPRWLSIFHHSKNDSHPCERLENVSPGVAMVSWNSAAGGRCPAGGFIHNYTASEAQKSQDLRLVIILQRFCKALTQQCSSRYNVGKVWVGGRANQRGWQQGLQVEVRNEMVCDSPDGHADVSPAKASGAVCA